MTNPSVRWNLTALLLLGFLLSPVPARAETIELVTYYPTSSNQGAVHTTSLTVGTAYADVALTDGEAIIRTNLGIGPGFDATAPAGLLHVVGVDNATSRVLFVPGANGTLQVGIGTNAPNALLHVVGTDNGASKVLFMPGNGGTLKVGIGTVNPATEFEVVSTSAAQPRGILSAQYSTDTNAALFIGRKARGTPTTSTAVANGDSLAGFVPEAYDGTNYQQTGWLGYVVNGTVAAGSVPSDFVLNTGSANQGTERLRVTAAGNVGIGTTSPQTTSPANNAATGNLDVNDIYIRAINGWASQTYAAAKMHQTARQTLPHSTNVPATFNTGGGGSGGGGTPVEFDVGGRGMADYPNNRFLIPVAGVYEVTVSWGGTGYPSDCILWVSVMRNGAVVAWFSQNSNSAGSLVVTGSEYFSFAANDSITMGFWHNFHDSSGNPLPSYTQGYWDRSSLAWCTPRMSVVRVR